MRFFALCLAWIGGEAAGQNQIYYGYYFGCRPDYTLCIQVQVLPSADFSTAMRIETFSDHVSVWSAGYKYDRLMHSFPSVKYRWTGGAVIELEPSSTGLEYSFQNGRSRLVTSLKAIQVSPLFLSYLSATQLKMLGVDLLYFRAPIAWFHIISFCRHINTWNLSEDNEKFLSFPLATSFERLVQLESQKRNIWSLPCCLGF